MKQHRADKMRIALVSSVFPPEPLTSGLTSHSLALALAKRGHDVTVLANYPNRPSGRTFSGFRRNLLPKRERENSFEVVRCFSTISRTSALLSRLAENLSFGLSAGLALAQLPLPDVVYINAWPIFAGGMVSFVAKTRRIPIVLSIVDVYPESLFALKKLDSTTWLAKFLRWLDASIARASFALVVISKSAESIYSRDRAIASERIHCIANWRDTEEQPAEETVERQREAWGAEPDIFLLVFAGNVAAACGIESVISLVSTELNDVRAQLVIAGSGGALESCRAIAKRYKSKKVMFTGSFPVEETLSILSAGDLLILPTQGGQSLVSMPSKVISYMMSGRPILAVARTESDLAKAVCESGCGWVVEPEDSAGLGQQLRKIIAMKRPELARIGLRGRDYALIHFSTNACLPRLVAVVESAAGRRDVQLSTGP
jgi:glycosyltransferase involved in cell wall biosynthesis